MQVAGDRAGRLVAVLLAAMVAFVLATERADGRGYRESAFGFAAVELVLELVTVGAEEVFVAAEYPLQVVAVVVQADNQPAAWAVGAGS